MKMQHWCVALALDLTASAECEVPQAIFFNQVLGCTKKACLTNHTEKPNEKSSYIEVAEKASCLLYIQDSCHLAPCIYILSSQIYLTIFYHSGSLSTCGYNINLCSHSFLCILMDVPCASLNTLGFNTSICCHQEQEVYKGKSKQTLEAMAVKNSWIDPVQKYMEGRILLVLNQHGIKGVLIVIHEQQIKTSYPSIMPDAVEITHIFHCNINLPNLILAPAQSKSNHLKFMQHLLKLVKKALCARIKSLTQREVLTDWGYTVSTTEHLSTTSDFEAMPELIPCDPLTLPIEIPSQIEDLNNSIKSSNYIHVVHAGSNNGLVWSTLVSELVKEDDIIFLMSSTIENNSCPTIDSSPLHSQLVMAGVEKPVIHKSIHDLKSYFYVLLGVFLLLNKPYKLKSNEDLTQCFNKYFNTFKPSILKMVMIQADLTWFPFILQHILLYFKPTIKLLICLQDTIISPIYMDYSRQFHHSMPFFHDTFIVAITNMLSELKVDA
ncbi:hypothetical protein V8B97DRAFT_2024966 [Scleroderma yunnanense]